MPSASWWPQKYSALSIRLKHLHYKQIGQGWKLTRPSQGYGSTQWTTPFLIPEDLPICEISFKSFDAQRIPSWRKVFLFGDPHEGQRFQVKPRGHSSGDLQYRFVKHSDMCRLILQTLVSNGFRQFLRMSWTCTAIDESESPRQTVGCFFCWNTIRSTEKKPVFNLAAK